MTRALSGLRPLSYSRVDLYILRRYYPYLKTVGETYYRNCRRICRARIYAHLVRAICRYDGNTAAAYPDIIVTVRRIHSKKSLFRKTHGPHSLTINNYLSNGIADRTLLHENKSNDPCRAEQRQHDRRRYSFFIHCNTSKISAPFKGRISVYFPIIVSSFQLPFSYRNSTSTTRCAVVPQMLPTLI